MRRQLNAGRRSSAAAAVALGIALAACAPGPSAAYQVAKGAGDRAYSSGRYTEAAGAYADAIRTADRPRDAAEAMYLEASAHQRSGARDSARAAYERLIAGQPQSHFARRAEFDLADLEIEAGNAEKGYERYRQLTTMTPDHGLARRAMERYLRHLESTGRDPAGWLKTILPQITATALDETARYALAGYLEKSADLQGARDAYLACAERHPYPKGALFDDALWHASRLSEALGSPEQAVAHLRAMLAVRETSTTVGSYERPRFSPAQFRIAVLYRDALRDPVAARREFHRLYVDHPTSILRDDALWEEAKLARDTGHAGDACNLAAALTKDFPTSRYAPCAGALCPSATAAPGRCHAYLIRSGGSD